MELLRNPLFTGHFFLFFSRLFCKISSLFNIFDAVPKASYDASKSGLTLSHARPDSESKSAPETEDRVSESTQKWLSSRTLALWGGADIDMLPQSIAIQCQGGNGFDSKVEFFLHTVEGVALGLRKPVYHFTELGIRSFAQNCSY